MFKIREMALANCPFWNCGDQDCQVAFSGESVGTKHCLHYCLSDDHDNCPLYLAEALRRSRIRTSLTHTLQLA